MYIMRCHSKAHLIHYCVNKNLVASSTMVEHCTRDVSVWILSPCMNSNPDIFRELESVGTCIQVLACAYNVA